MAYTQVKTPIVYYGGKTAILPHLHEMDLIDNVNYDNYTELFFGGGAFFFSKKQAKNETINDKLDIVINFYKQLRLNFSRLKKHIDATLISRSIHNEALNLIRAHKKKFDVDKVKLAWAFWVCTNFAYSNKIGGGYKFSNHMTVSVPQTLLKRKQNFTEHLVARIENAYIENEHWLCVANSRNTPKAFHYLDPPYCGADMGHYTGSFTWSDYRQLLEWCAYHCTGKFLLSNYNSEILDAFIKVHGWHKKEITHRIKAPRKSGAAKVEVLVSNYYTPCGTLKLF